MIGPDFWGYWWTAFERTVAEHQVAFHTVCDVACGTGETAYRLAQKGHPVYASDLDEDMIRVARKKCTDLPVTLAVEPMTETNPPEPVDLLLCCYDSLNMVESEDQLAQTLRAFFAALKPGGHVICDLATRRHLKEDWGTQEIHATVGDMETVWHTIWDGSQNRATIHLTATVPEGDNGLSVVSCRVQEIGFLKDRLDQLMGDAGFIIRDVRDMIPQTPGDDDGQRLFYLLQRPA